jgi:hypothetical protein
MPPRSFSNQSSTSVLQWHDNDSAYESVVEVKARSKESLPLTKSVRFSENNEIFLIAHIDEFSEEEVTTIWYDANEYAEMKADYKTTVFMMECGKSLPEDEHTSRGLEYRTQEGAWARYENKRDAYNAVLDEQDIQWKKDIDDCEALARVYLEHSTKCKEAALVNGRQDAAEAQKLYESFYQSENSNENNATKATGRKRTESLRRLFGSKN